MTAQVSKSAGAGGCGHGRFASVGLLEASPKMLDACVMLLVLSGFAGRAAECGVLARIGSRVAVEVARVDTVWF